MQKHQHLFVPTIFPIPIRAITRLGFLQIHKTTRVLLQQPRNTRDTSEVHRAQLPIQQFHSGSNGHPTDRLHRAVDWTGRRNVLQAAVFREVQQGATSLQNTRRLQFFLKGSPEAARSFAVSIIRSRRNKYLELKMVAGIPSSTWY